MRLLLKQLAEEVLGSRLVHAVARAIAPVDTIVLAYHNVVSSDAPPMGDVSLHLPLDAFLRQVTWLTRHFDVVPLEEVLDPGLSDRPRAVITFDDAYDGAVNLAIPALVERSIPATIFACSGWIGGESPWWDLVAFGEGGLSAEFRAEALQRLDGETSRVAAEAVRRGLPQTELPEDHRIASRADVHHAAMQSGITIGAHSVTHPNLTRLSDARLHDELASALESTLQLYQSGILWLAYPYGLMDQRVEQAARNVGYSAGLLVAGGPIRPESAARFSLPRMNVPRGVSIAGFKARCAGIL